MILLEILRGIAESIRETLPSTEQEAGPFVAGMVWAFVLFWLILFAVTWLTVSAQGGRP